MSAKKKRTATLAVALVCILAFVAFSKSNYEWMLAQTLSISADKSLIDSQNNANVDAAINREISKTKTMEEGSDVKSPGKAPEDELAPGKGSALTETKSDDFDPKKEFLQIRALAPVTIFSKLYCPFSKKLKKLLKENYTITPEPQIVELDKHAHGTELQEYVALVTSRKTVPNVVVGSTSSISRGGSDDFELLHKEGTLAQMLNQWGEKEISVTKLGVPSNS